VFNEASEHEDVHSSYELFYVFVNFALDENEYRASQPDKFTAGVRATVCHSERVGPTDYFDDVQKGRISVTLDIKTSFLRKLSFRIIF
jgi:hypothetical protein